MFSTFAGLRGAVSLILAQQLVLDQSKYPHEARVIAEVRTQNTDATFEGTLTRTLTLALSFTLTLTPTLTLTQLRPSSALRHRCDLSEHCLPSPVSVQRTAASRAQHCIPL